MRCILDLDGVIWLEGVPIPGSAAAVDRLRSARHEVVFVTNNSIFTSLQLARRLERCEISVSPRDLLSSATAAASLVEPDELVLVLGGEGIVEALERRGARTVLAGAGTEATRPDVVVAGLDRELDYARVTAALRAVLAGARLIGTNDDPTFPLPDGPAPGAGAIVAMLERAAGRRASIAGKPHPATVALATERLGQVDLVVGDRASTDGELARRCGARFGLVLTGVTPPGHGPLDPEPDLEAPDLATLVEKILEYSTR